MHSSNNHIDVLFPSVNTSFQWGLFPKYIRTCTHKRYYWVSQEFQPSILSFTWHQVTFHEKYNGSYSLRQPEKDKHELHARMEKLKALKSDSWLQIPSLPPLSLWPWATCLSPLRAFSSEKWGQQIYLKEAVEELSENLAVKTPSM